MIVYGDPAYEATLSELVTRLIESSSDASPDGRRAFLILAGQVEQAVEDAGLEEAARFREVTDQAARAFLSVGEISLQGLPRSEARLSVKLPEGFAFYGLYPERYMEATRRWMDDHPDAGRVLVVGLRSIGTSLSALVVATLREGGRGARRVTVRPFGHPFSREVRLSPDDVEGVDWVLAVDEGPGLSGSSMVAVAEAACRLGVSHDRIAFFPGHPHEPGGQTSQTVRNWWSSVPRYVETTDPIPEALAARTAEITGQTVGRVEDLSAGRWRETVYDDPDKWPAVAAPFERRKIQIVLSDGSAVLWRFVGLASHPEEDPFALLAARAKNGWTSAPLELTLGFLATPWIEGLPLARQDDSPFLRGHVGGYIAAVARPALSERESEAAKSRLIEMLATNAREAFGDLAADRTYEIGERASNGFGLPSYGDGRMAPYEWLRTHDGKVLKTDSLGHSWDHTAVGRQPITWDIAGAMVEWGWDDLPTLSVPPDDLRFHRLAYAAFRLGQCRLCASMTGDEAERKRLQRAEALYSESLRRGLAL